MRNPRVAYRYAKALVDYAVENKQLDVVKKDVDLLRATTTHELNAAISSPVISGDRKAKIFAAVFHDRVSKVTEDFSSCYLRRTVNLFCVISVKHSTNNTILSKV